MDGWVLVLRDYFERLVWSGFFPEVGRSNIADISPGSSGQVIGWMVGYGWVEMGRCLCLFAFLLGVFV